MNVLVISAHPDDETLGCGGTILRHCASGDRVHWLIVTRAHNPVWSPELVETKAEEIQAVAQAYGMQGCQQLEFTAAALDTVPTARIIQALREVVTKIQPAVVYSVYGGDVHTDHQRVYEAMSATLKSFQMARVGVRRLLCYETPSSTDAAPATRGRTFLPIIFCDITPYLDRKIEILRLYGSEAQLDPWPRGPSAVRALARMRGAAIGVEYAEAFMLVREIC